MERLGSNEKGHELEDAVHAIEAVILQSSPTLREKSFRIEPRKRVTVGGVHHEIDIFVTVAIAQGYNSTFLFECKNWKDAVDKNEIIVFAEKVDAVSAQHGYVVAKSFTKDAGAQAVKDARITLLVATEHNPATTITPESFHITAPATTKTNITFRVAGTAGTNVAPLNIQGKTCRIGGKEMLVTDYLNAWMDELYAKRLLGFQTAHLPEGIHPMSAEDERAFTPGDCVVDGQEMEHVRVDVEFGVQIIRPAVISDYEVATRGRVIRLERVKVRDLTIDTAFVTLKD
jgi:hypothetical protein